MPRVLIATGGTGGHVFPAMALANELKEAGMEVEVAGAKLSSNRYLDKTFPFHDIRSGSGLKDVLQITCGVYDSLQKIRAFKPQVIVGFGSYHTFPLLAAGTLSKTPLVLWAADSVPGKVIRWFAPFAKVIGVQFPEAKKQLKGPAVLTSMPLRKGFHKEALSQREARNYYQLPGNKPVCLVFGGSQGAKYLNDHLPDSLEGFEAIHFTGSREEAERVERRYQARHIASAVKAFEPEMALAWRAADVACIRAGAVTIAEQLAFEVPALLIPFPFAMDNHQEKNADFVVSLNLAVKRLEGATTASERNLLLQQLWDTKKERQESFQSFKQKNQVTTLKALVMEQL